MYTKEDYKYLSHFLQYMYMILTPNILSETSNLLQSLNQGPDHEIYNFFKDFISSLEEKYISSKLATDTDCFIKYGLTDGTIYSLAEEGFLVLTDDFELYHYLINTENVAINFNHIRTQYYLD